MEKQVLVFKMKNKENGAEVLATHKYIGVWQKKGFSAVGYKVLDKNEFIYDLSVNDISDNLY